MHYLLLDAETVEAMLTAGDNNHGLGPGITDDGLRFGHGGANAGFRCFLTYFKDGRGGVAVMTNSDSGGRLAHELTLSVAREYGWPGMKPEVIEVVQLDDTSLEALAGTYVFDRRDVEVRRAEGHLVAKQSWSDREIILMPTSSTEFAARDEGMRVAFETDNGKGAVLVVNGGPRGERK